MAALVALPGMRAAPALGIGIVLVILVGIILIAIGLAWLVSTLRPQYLQPPMPDECKPYPFTVWQVYVHLIESEWQLNAARVSVKWRGPGKSFCMSLPSAGSGALSA